MLTAQKAKQTTYLLLYAKAYGGAIPVVTIAACLEADKKTTPEILSITFDTAEKLPKNNLVESIGGQLLAVSEKLKNALDEKLRTDAAQRVKRRVKNINRALAAAASTAFGVAGWYVAPEQYRDYVKGHAVRALEKGVPWIKQRAVKLFEGVQGLRLPKIPAKLPWDQ